MNNSTAWALTAIVGLGVGALSYWLIENPLLSGTLAVVYATCTRLTTDYASVLPGEIKGDEWETTRWSVAFIVLVMGASLFGISATLPISLERLRRKADYASRQPLQIGREKSSRFYSTQHPTSSHHLC